MKILFIIIMLFSLSVYGNSIMPKSRYIDLMEKILSAYSEEHIERYYNDVKRGGLKEHGYPRLTANIGILIAHGKRTDLKPLFVKMMDLCCEEMPKRKKAANEFSIKEIIFCLMELEKNKTFPQSQINKWKDTLRKVTVEKCYNIYAKSLDSTVHNWAIFAMVSELMRYHVKVASPDKTFIEYQAGSQWRRVDENGMYRDPNEPMVYDLVSRGLFAVANHFGYRGEYFKRWDDALKRAGLHTLQMLSVTGEIPYGGRSNQFLHNEAHLAIIFEYEAARYAKLGDMKTAAKFKAAVKRTLDNISLWLEEKPITHVKNSFPRSFRFASQYGCEGYAYFDKYMITAASFLYPAYLLSDEKIPCGELDDVTGSSWQTSDHFHKIFLRAGEYFAEYDYKADYHYDASGMGRLHRKGAPSAICLSTPGTDKPSYKISADDAIPFAIAPAVMSSGKWLSGADRETIHKVVKHGASGASAFTEINCIFADKTELASKYLLDRNGLKITLKGTGKIGLMLPAFKFDGKNKTVIKVSANTLSITYKGWICRYQIESGKITDIVKNGYNRNGHYDLFRAEGDKNLTVQVSIEPAQAK